MRSLLAPLGILVVAGVLWWALRGEKPADVVLYCAVDQDQSIPIAQGFEKETGLDLRYEGEVETLRSVGLSARIEEERDAPRADVFWNNEIMATVHLADRDLLGELPAGTAELFPERWRDPARRWIAFGARVRVLLVNTKLLPDAADHPRSIRDLLDPKYAAMGLKTAMAVPLTGTTRTHAVALLTRSPDDAQSFFERVAKAREDGTMMLAPGNGTAMGLVRDATNKVAFCLTDTDDAHVAVREGAPVTVVYPDQGDEDPGALVIPNTVALVRGGPHPEAAAQLLRYLVSPEVERALADGPSAQIPLRPDNEVPAHVKRPVADFRAMDVDWEVVGRNLERWAPWLQSTFRQ